MFSLFTASRSQPPWPPMPIPAMFSLLFGEAAPPRPRTDGLRIMNEAPTPAEAVAARKLRREIGAFCGDVVAIILVLAVAKRFIGKRYWFCSTRISNQLGKL